MKKVFKMIGISFLLIICILFVFLGILAVNSPGKLEPLKDKNGEEIIGSITEKNFVNIGGIEQGFFIRGENPENPVILFLHGGPGSPELPIIIPFENSSERLEKYFTVCYWDQRGAGMSFNSSIDTSTITVEQFVEDTRELTEYLKKRFNKEKIYLMGHSWGSLLGVKTIEEYPNNYFAYIGIGQVSNQMESEKLAYDYMLRYATEINDKSAVKKLKKYGKSDSDFPNLDYIATVRSLLMNKYGIGMMRDNPSMLNVIKNILFFEGYTLSEKFNYIKGIEFTQTLLWNEVLKADFFESPNIFQVPFYIVHGKYDYQVSYALAREWFDKIKVPKKEFFTFENSAHSPNMEEYDKFVEIVRGITSR